MAASNCLPLPRPSRSPNSLESSVNRRDFLTTTAAGAAATALPFRSAAASLQGEQLVMDAMGELRTVYDRALIQQMLDSGMDSITITLCDPKPLGAEALELAVDSVLEHDRFIDSNGQQLVKATTIADVDAARRDGRLAVFYLFQNTVQFGTSLDRVDMFYRLGLRSCQLTYNERNDVGVGCREEGDDGGLTEFGRELIDHMNSIGMLVDLSHANMPTMAEAIEHSAAPVHVSHTACNDLYPHVRNTSDENLRALADNGGLVGVCQLRPFLTELKQDNLHTYFDHIDHAVNVAGVEAVCIGSDRDHRVIEMTDEYLAELRSEEGSQVVNHELPYFIDELNGPSRMTVVRDGLERRGYSSGDIDRIMGTNLYRLYADVIG